MRRLMFFAGGGVFGALIGAAAALLMTPASGDALRSDTRSRFSGAMSVARLAAEERRQELEAQLAQMTNLTNLPSAAPSDK
jgi:gas vesicle protein